MDDNRQRAERIAEAAQRRGLTVAVAESLTGGLLASQLAAAPAAAEWFHGGVVAYSRRTKHEVLRVPPGPVVSATAALAMARGVAGLLDADLSVAVTGAGGPDPQDGQPPGTVWIAVSHDDRQHAELHHFAEPDPAAVCERTCTEALNALLTSLSQNG